MRLIALSLLGACGTSDTAVWAFQHAEVTVSPDLGSVEGYQTWEFYSERWEQTRDEREHICARVQRVAGEAEATLPEGCPGCLASYALTIHEVETDCAGLEGAETSYAGVTRYAIGAVDQSIEALDPYPGDSLGWYVSWSGEDVVALGFAWDAALDLSQEPESSGWEANQAYVLWPAFVWDLRAE